MSVVEPFDGGCRHMPDGTFLCWLHDRHDLLRGKAGWQAEGSVLRLGWRDGKAAGSALFQRSAAPSPAEPTDADVEAAMGPGGRGLAFFLLELDGIEAVARGARADTGAANFDARCDAAAMGMGLAGIGFADRAVTSLRRALELIQPFLSSLDPAARPLVRNRVALSAVGEMDLYPGLDATFGTGAPLARAWGWLPHMTTAAARLYREDGTRFARAASESADAVSRLVRASLAEVDGDVAAALAMRCATAMAAMEPGQAERMGFDIGSGSDDPWRDHAARAGTALARLPTSWWPRDAPGWVDFGRCFPAVAWAIGCTEGDDAGRMLNAMGDWAGLGRRLASAHGGKARRTALETAIRDVSDMATAFGDQSIMPALASVGTGMRPRAMEAAAWGMLFSGRSAVRILEMSRDWHGRNDAMLDALPDGGAVAGWEPTLPDAEVGPVSIRVLGTRAALRAEGATGRDRHGASGLAHCVGGYAGRCLSGESRILSLRAGSGPDAPRLSTAEVAWRGGAAAELQHRGRRNGEPPSGAAEALAAYLGMLSSGALTASAPDLPSARSEDVATHRCGYDWRHPGNRERAHALWGRYLPAHLRAGTAETLAGIATEHGSDRPRWHAHALGLPGK